MRLIIDNLAKVGHANLAFNGITIIAGNNDTGKSTVGKALFAMFTIFKNIEDRIKKLRLIKIDELVEEFDKRFIFFQPDFYEAGFTKQISMGQRSIEAILKEMFSFVDQDKEKPDLAEWTRRFNEITSLSEEELRSQVAFNVISNIFHRQCTSFRRKDTHPNIELEVKKKNVQVQMSDTYPKCEVGINLLHTAFYIDSPDSLSAMAEFRSNAILKKTDGRLGAILVRSIWDGYNKSLLDDSNAIDEVLRRKRFAAINEKLTSVMNGSVVYSKERGLRFVSNDFPDKPLRLDNLSQGLKAMALLQVAFMNGAIWDDDILILDEPEIHLHPEWQIKYAEFIVMLQKEFHLTILLTSHSPDFIQAVRLYAKKYKLNEEVINAYLSQRDKDGMADFKEIKGQDWDEVFEKFVTSFDALMALRSELEEVNESKFNGQS